MSTPVLRFQQFFRFFVSFSIGSISLLQHYIPLYYWAIKSRDLKRLSQNWSVLGPWPPNIAPFKRRNLLMQGWDCNVINPSSITCLSTSRSAITLYIVPLVTLIQFVRTFPFLIEKVPKTYKGKGIRFIVLNPPKRAHDLPPLAGTLHTDTI